MQFIRITFLRKRNMVKVEFPSLPSTTFRDCYLKVNYADTLLHVVPISEKEKEHKRNENPEPVASYPTSLSIIDYKD